MSAKAVIGVIIVAIFIGVLYVVFEKNFLGSPTLSNSQPTSKTAATPETTVQTQQKSSLIELPTSDPTPTPVTGSTDLQKEAESLEMRDYSTYFEELEEKAQE